DLPEPDVVPPVRAPAVGFLERELLLFSFVIERTDGRVMVGPVKHHAADDLDARSQGDRVGWKPTCRVHGAHDVVLAADQPDIESVTRDIARRARHHRQRSKTWLVFMMAPQARQQDVSESEVGYNHTREDTPPASPARSPLHGRFLHLRRLEPSW